MRPWARVMVCPLLLLLLLLLLATLRLSWVAMASVASVWVCAVRAWARTMMGPLLLLLLLLLRRRRLITLPRVSTPPAPSLPTVLITWGRQAWRRRCACVPSSLLRPVRLLSSAILPVLAPTPLAPIPVLSLSLSRRPPLGRRLPMACWDTPLRPAGRLQPQGSTGWWVSGASSGSARSGLTGLRAGLP